MRKKIRKHNKALRQGPVKGWTRAQLVGFYKTSPPIFGFYKTGFSCPNTYQANQPVYLFNTLQHVPYHNLNYFSILDESVEKKNDPSPGLSLKRSVCAILHFSAQLNTDDDPLHI